MYYLVHIFQLLKTYFIVGFRGVLIGFLLVCTLYVNRTLLPQEIVDMATSVALEMEEKRRKEEWEKMEEETKTKVP